MTFEKFYTNALGAALVAAITLVIILAVQKRSLLEQSRESAVRSRDPYAGFYVPEIDIQTLSGDTVRIGECAPDRIQLLFVFATTCDYCKASIPAWRRIASGRQGDPDVEVYGISIDSAEATSAFVAQHDLGFPVVSFADRKLRNLYRSGIVPQTVVLDAHGMVRYARIGAVTDEIVVDSILAQLGTPRWGATQPEVQ